MLIPLVLLVAAQEESQYAHHPKNHGKYYILLCPMCQITAASQCSYIDMAALHQLFKKGKASHSVYEKQQK